MLRSIWDELEDMNRRFEETFRPFATFPVRRYTYSTFPTSDRPFVPSSEVFARKADLVIRLDLPGIDPEKDVKVTVDGEDLCVYGERKQNEEFKEEGYYRTETWYGTFERHFTIPKGVDEKAIKASYHHGLLELVVKNAVHTYETEKKQVKTIPIETVKTPELAGKA